MVFGLPERQLPNIEKHDLARGKLGVFETRLAENAEEVEAAQTLRYRVFCEELAAEKNLERIRYQRESDQHDEKCDHLLILSEKGELIGTQRLMVRDADVGAAEFYSNTEYNLAPMLNQFVDKRFMELGRSCILPEYRDKRTMELLWHATWDYAVKRAADVMFGCASFHTLDPSEIAEPLGFLAEYVPLQKAWQVQSHHPNKIDMLQFIDDSALPKKAIRALPPLIKGYLRLGAMFSTHAVPDPDFGTIDVLVVLPIASINPRYVKYYGQNADRHKPK